MDPICIVGGSGFIGTRLTQRLIRNGRSVSIVDKVASRTFPELIRVADVRNLSSLQDAVPSDCVLVNLAAEHRDDVRPQSLYEDVNVGGARNICAVARERNIRKIIFTSSVAVYGFAPVGTDESGGINPFNEYGRTKFAAEEVLKAWQEERPTERTLVIVRPTVVFGEQNRGNVYNLLRQIASGKFVMIGSGENRKSMAYVENVCAFIEHALGFVPGVHVYNYVDKPDLTMNALVSTVRELFGTSGKKPKRIPYSAGYAIGLGFDLLATLTKRNFAISSIRVKKFCTNTVFGSSVPATGFRPPVDLADALRSTVRHEFLRDTTDQIVFYTE